MMVDDDVDSEGRIRLRLLLPTTIAPQTGSSPDAVFQKNDLIRQKTVFRSRQRGTCMRPRSSRTAAGSVRDSTRLDESRCGRSTGL